MTQLKNVLESQYRFIKSNSDMKDAFVLDGSVMKDKRSSLSEIYHKLGFESYIPYANYDGLAELLSKDVWPERENLKLYIEKSDVFFEHLGDDEVHNLFNVFEDVSKGWLQPNGLDGFVVCLEG
jgi:hypothetical protein